MPLRRLAYVIAFTFAVLSAARADDFKLKIIAFNDFHGNLQSPGNYRANAQSALVPSGGVDFFAGYIEHLKSENPTNVVVSAGDLIGASPLVSALFHDEDTIEAFNRLGLEFTSVGNHEFDKGKQELLRLQNGGCSTLDQNTCKGASAGLPVPFEGAKFKYLAANVFDTSTGKTLFPGYAVKTYNGVKVAFIGLTLKDTPTIVTPSGVAGLRFADEASTINAIVRQLRPLGIESFVVLIHQGGEQTTKGTVDVNACEGGLHGSPIESIVNNLDNAVDLVISGHTHAAYICQIANSTGRKIFVTSASSYGHLLTDIDVTIDTKTRDITGVTAHNVVVDRTNSAGITPDTGLKSIVDKYAAMAAPITNQEVGAVTASICKNAKRLWRISIGRPDRRCATGGHQRLRLRRRCSVFHVNAGGIRADIPFSSGTPGVPAGSVTYGELFTVQPFGNSLVTLTLTGAQIKTLLEEQFKGCALDAPAGEDSVPPDDRVMQVSAGFTYTYSRAGTPCEKVDPGSIKIHGVTVNPTAKYRVTVNNFMADGGGQLPVLRRGTDRLGGPQDIDALTAYFAKHRSIAPDQADRINVKP